MNEIIRSILKWIDDTHIIPEIFFTTEYGGYYLNIILRCKGKNISESFYIPGGYLCLKNWDGCDCNEELEHFINDAKQRLLKESENDK